MGWDGILSNKANWLVNQKKKKKESLNPELLLFNYLIISVC